MNTLYQALTFVLSAYITLSRNLFRCTRYYKYRHAITQVKNSLVSSVRGMTHRHYYGEANYVLDARTDGGREQRRGKKTQKTCVCVCVCVSLSLSLSPNPAVLTTLRKHSVCLLVCPLFLPLDFSCVRATYFFYIPFHQLARRGGWNCNTGLLSLSYRRARFYEIQQATMVLQAVARMRRARALVKRKQASAVKVQAAWRGWRQREWEKRCEREEGATNRQHLTAFIAACFCPGLSGPGRW